MKAVLTLVTSLSLLTPGLSAWACHADIDCKGARVCDAGLCVAPSGEEAFSSDIDFYRVERLRVGAKRRAVAGMVLAPLTAVATGALMVTAASGEDGLFALPGAAALALGIAAGATAGVGSKYARRGLLELGAPSGRGLSVAGWVVWAVGLGGMALSAVGALAVDDEDGQRTVAVLGGGASGALMTVGSLLQSIAALKYAGELGRELDAPQARTRLDVAPIALADGAGLSVGMTF